MRKLKILHLASFDGNVGDNANHKGSRVFLRKNLGYDIEYTNLEIREFYWNIRKFDEEFVQLSNQHDVVMIGGGNYFELWVENSYTGTSLNLSREILEKINSPIVFYALGCDAGQGVPEENVLKFKAFLDYLNGSSKYLISIRNDGSEETIKGFLGEKYLKNIYKVPDGGFFTEVEDFYHPELPDSKKIIAVNLAGDMLDRRFCDNGRNSYIINYEQFLKDFGSLINNQLRQDAETCIVFVPHIFKDISVIADVLQNVEDRFRRNRITVAPYLHGKNAQEYIFDLYRKCNLVLGNRFHSNVCSIGLCVPTIGLVNYPQIEKMYKELNIYERTVKINEQGFGDRLNLLINNSMADQESIKKTYGEIKTSLVDQIDRFHDVMRRWIEDNLPS